MLNPAKAFELWRYSQHNQYDKLDTLRLMKSDVPQQVIWLRDRSSLAQTREAKIMQRGGNWQVGQIHAAA